MDERKVKRILRSGIWVLDWVIKFTRSVEAAYVFSYILTKCKRGNHFNRVHHTSMGLLSSSCFLSRDAIKRTIIPKLVKFGLITVNVTSKGTSIELNKKGIAHAYVWALNGITNVQSGEIDRLFQAAMRKNTATFRLYGVNILDSILIACNRDHKQALILSQIAYWLKRIKDEAWIRNEQGKKWLRFPMKYFENKGWLSHEMTYKAFRELIKRKLILELKSSEPRYTRSRYVTINKDEFERIIKERIEELTALKRTRKKDSGYIMQPKWQRIEWMVDETEDSEWDLHRIDTSETEQEKKQQES